MTYPASPGRIRGRKLQTIRAAHFAKHPLCVRCDAAGKTVVATQLDHIVALDNGGKDFDVDPANAQGLCVKCHKAKTDEDMGYRTKAAIGVDGWPL